ncbi:MAG TPA: hypothetical protein PK239_03175 [Chitinophagales bacterium]|nr:hypothetical protein [Chitinophagales bacterium]HRK26272.1 hypothetical protein [Chitinophagales bacterium]
MRFTILCLIFCLVSVAGYAQTKTESVVYLKNGSVLRGELVNPESSGKISIKIVGNNLFVFDLAEVEKITTESKYKPNFAPKKGYSAMNEVGMLVSTGNESAGLVLQTIHGYSVNPYLTMGAGVGLHVYYNLPMSYYYYYTNSTKVIPVFANVSGELLPAYRVSPYYYGRVGYGIDATDREAFADSRGGLMFGVGVGMKVKGNNQLSWILGVGYQFQKYYAEFQQWEGSTVTNNLSIRRLAITTGIAF